MTWGDERRGSARHGKSRTTGDAPAGRTLRLHTSVRLHTLDPHRPRRRSASSASRFPQGDRVRRRPGRGSKAALAQALAALTADPGGRGPAGIGPLGAVVDCVVAARRLAGWSLWVELAGLATLLALLGGPSPADRTSWPTRTSPSRTPGSQPIAGPVGGVSGSGSGGPIVMSDRGAAAPADVHLGDLAGCS